MRFDLHAVRDRHGDHVGQVVLALRVVRLQRGDPAGERLGRRGHHAGIDLVDAQLLGRRVALLDDAAHVAVRIAQDAAEPASDPPSSP